MDQEIQNAYLDWLHFYTGELEDRKLKEKQDSCHHRFEMWHGVSNCVNCGISEKEFVVICGRYYRKDDERVIEFLDRKRSLGFERS